MRSCPRDSALLVEAASHAARALPDSPHWASCSSARAARQIVGLWVAHLL